MDIIECVEAAEAKEEDILLDEKGAQHVRYLSSGMDCGVHVAVLGSGQILETQ